jgi:hypothetical protein
VAAGISWVQKDRFWVRELEISLAYLEKPVFYPSEMTSRYPYYVNVGAPRICSVYRCIARNTEVGL